MSDIIRKANRKTNFTTVNNDFLHDVNLTWKAKGLIIYIMSLPPDWDLNVSDLKNRSKDGRDATAAGIRELIDNSYCRRIRSREKGGVFAGYDYEVSDIRFDPKTDNPVMVEIVTGKPTTVEPFTENPTTDKPEQVNTNFNKETLKVNTDNNNTPPPASLFPDLEKTEEDDKKKKTLFKNSGVFKMVTQVPGQPHLLNYSELEKHFPGEDYEKVDIMYYFNSVNDWSDQKDMKRTKAGWLATIRNFMRGDVEKNKLKLKPQFRPESQKLDVAGAMDYLNEYD
jgi:hypothetical protein